MPVEGVELPVHADEHILDDIIGVFMAADDPSRRPVDPLLIPANEFIERPLIPKAKRLDQLLIGLIPHIRRVFLEIR